MSESWRIVRVFISSTFRDMHGERDYLVKVVFPTLRERLEKYRVHLVDIDLRWGITAEQSDNDQVLELCLSQIDDCRPFFLGLLGERYGWVPAKWPILPDEFDWTRQYTEKSVTELEILYGVLLKPEMRDHGLFFFRDPTFLHEVPPEKRGEVQEQDPLLARKLADLKDRIRKADLPIPIVENYPCRYAGLRINWRLARFDLGPEDQTALASVAADGLLDNTEYAGLDERLKKIVNKYGVVHLTGLEEFGRQVLERLWNAIQQEMKLAAEPQDEREADPLREEQEYHERFMESRLRVYVGRTELQRQLSAFADGSDDKPTLVTGPSGSGKSAALAKFATEYATKHPDVVVIPHFIGASPGSTSLRRTLHRFCSTLKKAFQFTEEVPLDTNSLITTFREFITKIPANRRVLFVVDALNQFDESDNAHNMYWLPWQFPPHVKFVMSCIDDPGREEPVLTAIANRQHIRIDVPPLRDDERQQIVKEVPSLSAKTLDPKQVGQLLANPATANPLFLLVALEELRGFGSYEQLGRRIELFPTGDDAVSEIFKQVIERLQDEFDPATVYDVLSLLASARRGLSDRELLDIIESPNVGIDHSEGDLFPILRQLRPYLQHRGELRDFFHRGLYKAVGEQFLPDDGSRSAAHAKLVDYFKAQDYFRESLEEQRARAKRLPPTPRPANIRKVDELPYQMLQVAILSGKDDPKSPHWDAVADLFTELEFLEAKAEAQE